MNHRLIQGLLCVLALASSALAEGPYRQPQKGPTNAPSAGQNAAGAPNAEKKVDVCKLLTSTEIQGVQGSRVEESR
jgi:hypothetical protein